MSEESIDVSDFLRNLNVQKEAIERARKRMKETDAYHERVVREKEKLEEMFDRERRTALTLSGRLSLFGIIGAGVIAAVDAYTGVDMAGIVFGLLVFGGYTEIMAARKMADASITRSMITECAAAIVSIQLTRDSLVRNLAHEEAVRNMKESMGGDRG